MFVTDNDDRTPMGYLLTESSTEEAILPVIKIAVKYGFDLLRNGPQI